MSTIMRASKEWAERPADQRFASLDDLHAAVLKHRETAAEAETPYSALRIEADSGTPMLVGPSGARANFTNWSFGQLANRVGAPPSYLRLLPASLAADCLNQGIKDLDQTDEKAAGKPDKVAKLYLAQNGGLTVRALTGPGYTRVFDSEVTERAKRMVELHPEWQPAPAAFDGSRGLYASDHDVFMFFVDNERRIFETAPGGGLSRGVMFANSEVGAASFWALKFFYEFICGNHRVWGASGLTEIRIPHIGRADDKIFRQLAAELRKYADGSATEDEAKIVAAKRMILGANKDEVLDKIFGLRIPMLGRKRIEEAFDKAEEHSEWYGDPKSVWGFTGGLTELAKDNPFSDDRVALDRAAGKVLQIAF